MILGRLIRTLRAEHLSLIPVKWVTKIFVAGDIVSFTLQAGGGGIQSSGNLDLFKVGEKTIIGGLFVQLIFFGFFVVMSALFHHRISRSPTDVAVRGDIPWKRYLWVLYSASGLIWVRSVFRVVEYMQGNDGYLVSHEAFLYLFDTLLMAAVMVIFLIWYVEHLESTRGYAKWEQYDSENCMLEELPITSRAQRMGMDLRREYA